MASGLWPIDRYELECPESGLSHQVEVSLPARYDEIENPDIVVCMDGPWLFGAVDAACRVMSMSREAPEAVVVGVSFTEDSVREYINQRARWFTPTGWVPPPEVGVRDVAAHECGRADVTVAFLDKVLMPRLREEHGDGRAWYVGHSFTALLGLRALFTRPHMFSNWILASPSIWWDDRAILASEQEWAQHHDDLAANVLLTAGELEEAAFGPAYSLLGNVVELCQTLEARGYPRLRVRHRALENETHASTIGAAVSAGLRDLLA